MNNIIKECYIPVHCIDCLPIGIIYDMVYPSFFTLRGKYILTFCTQPAGTYVA